MTLIMVSAVRNDPLCAVVGLHPDADQWCGGLPGQGHPRPQRTHRLPLQQLAK